MNYNKTIIREIFIIIIETIATVILLSIFDYNNVSKNLLAVIIGNIIFFSFVTFVKYLYKWRDKE